MMKILRFYFLQVTDKNVAVESAPSLINKSCYEQGWLFRVKLATSEDLQALMDQAAYDKYLEELQWAESVGHGDEQNYFASLTLLDFH